MYFSPSTDEETEQLRKVRKFTQGHRATEAQSQDQNPGLPYSKSMLHLPGDSLWCLEVIRALCTLCHVHMAWALKPWPPGRERAIQHICIWVMVVTKQGWREGCS